MNTLSFEERLGKQVIIKKKMLIPFEERLGKQVIIKRFKLDQLMKKQRYLNTISNKKKLLNFNRNSDITDLEEIRLLYNENVSQYNQRAETHNAPIRKNKRIENYRKKKEEKIIKHFEKIDGATKTIQKFYKNHFVVKIEVWKSHFLNLSISIK